MLPSGEDSAATRIEGSNEGNHGSAMDRMRWQLRCEFDRERDRRTRGAASNGSIDLLCGEEMGERGDQNEGVDAREKDRELESEADDEGQTKSRDFGKALDPSDGE